MKPQGGNASLVILALLAVAALAQCGHKQHRYDPCVGHRRVTIGGSMVIACQ